MTEDSSRCDSISDCVCSSYQRFQQSNIYTLRIMRRETGSLVGSLSYFYAGLQAKFSFRHQFTLAEPD